MGKEPAKLKPNIAICKIVEMYDWKNKDGGIAIKLLNKSL